MRNTCVMLATVAIGWLSACSPSKGQGNGVVAASTAHIRGAMQHNYVVYPGDVNGNALDNMQRDPLIQKYWPQLEGHHTFVVGDPTNSWDGKYDYFSSHKPSYEEDFAAPSSPIGPSLASGIAIAVGTQAELDAVVAALKQAFKGATNNIVSSDETIDVSDLGLPIDKRISEFQRKMVQVFPTTGVDGQPAFASNFFAWVTLEDTLDGKGTQTTQQVVAPHLQPGKLPAFVTSLTYALNTADRQNLGVILQSSGYAKHLEGANEVWVGGESAAKIRIQPNEDPKAQGLVSRTYALDEDVLEQVRDEFESESIHRDFGFGVSLDISADGAKATLSFQSSVLPAQ